MISVFELFKVGVGPSSSHTVGPMIAAYRFAHEVTEQSEIARCCARIRVELYGSLALTGLGHATDTAIFCGLAGCLPDRTEVDKLQRTVESLRTNQAQQTWTPMSSSALHAEFKEIVYKSFLKEKELV